MFLKGLILAMVMMEIYSEPQGPGYLPPSGGVAPRPGGGGGGGHPDEWAGDPVNYEYSYEVQDAAVALDFGHHEERKDDEAKGSYHVLLPDGRTQIVDYIADANGYRPMVRYEGTATYPAPGPQRGSDGEGYKY
ncbi:hypothetical protein HCN44_008265 [Aphidius gifuensis]|uniref:Cuticular protein n=1 Tax=Aphidius gifuensis TaxID=684658 RepID=A0A834XMR6_APHGI|nr:pro-resilin-like [Aphidius gifuensis]KAF7989591.1 hypothetical protein HCN44_008265 [Aphidius gifuensis]